MADANEHAPGRAGESSRVLDICCVLFVAFSACVLMTIAFETFDDAAANRLRAMYFSLNKHCLDFGELLDFWLQPISSLASSQRTQDGLSSAEPLDLRGGAASLPIFALTVVLSFAGKFVVLAFGHTLLGDAIVTGLGS